MSWLTGFSRRHSGLRNIENKRLNQMKVVSLLVTATASQQIWVTADKLGRDLTRLTLQGAQDKLGPEPSLCLCLSCLLGVSPPLRQAPPMVLQDVSVESGASRLLTPPIQQRWKVNLKINHCYNPKSQVWILLALISLIWITGPSLNPSRWRGRESVRLP